MVSLKPSVAFVVFLLFTCRFSFNLCHSSNKTCPRAWQATKIKNKMINRYNLCTVMLIVFRPGRLFFIFCKDYPVIMEYTTCKPTNLQSLPVNHPSSVSFLIGEPTTNQKRGLSHSAVYDWLKAWTGIWDVCFSTSFMFTFVRLQHDLPTATSTATLQKADRLVILPGNKRTHFFFFFCWR